MTHYGLTLSLCDLFLNCEYIQQRLALNNDLRKYENIFDL